MKCRCGHTKHEHVCPAPGRCCSGGHLAPHKVPRIEAVCHGTQECKCKQFDPEGEMKWKVGQVYKSRGGKDCRVLAIDSPMGSPLNKYSIVSMDLKTGVARNHMEDGRAHPTIASIYDLMPRVTKVEGWIIMIKDSGNLHNACGYYLAYSFFATEAAAQKALDKFPSLGSVVVPVSFEVPED